MEENMHQSSDNHSIPMTSVSSGKGVEVKPDIYYYTNQIVNLVFIGNPKSEWILIDAGMPNSAKEIIAAATGRFGENNPPKCILLTHGHFDHIGSIVDLLKEWKDVPVFAHQMEFPFLTGQQDYPKPDTSVEGGMLAKISFLYPHKATNISPVLQELPSDGTVPNLPDWRWFHTPGHSPGHVSFFRISDKVLIAGDAFVTVRQDSFYKVLIQDMEVNGPPPYLTTDWVAAKQSVILLNELNPLVAITGHGTFIEGAELSEGLSELAKDFEDVAVPAYGRYVKDRE